MARKIQSTRTKQTAADRRVIASALLTPSGQRLAFQWIDGIKTGGMAVQNGRTIRVTAAQAKEEFQSNSNGAN